MDDLYKFVEPKQQQQQQRKDNNNMSPRGESIDFTLQDSVENLLTKQCLEGGHCMDAIAEKELRDLPGNDACIDCGKAEPEWASVNLGVFMCLDCSGQHRALGTHISFVRSVRMDSWSEQQLKMMFLGGNQQCTDYLMRQGMKNLSSNPKPFSRMTIKERYDCAASLLYQQVLEARRDGQPEPTKLPDYTPTPAATHQPVKKTTMVGIGGSNSSKRDDDEKPKVSMDKPRSALENAMSSLFKNITLRTKQ